MVNVVNFKLGETNVKMILVVCRTRLKYEPTMEDKRTWDCVKKPFQAIVPYDSAPKDNLLFAFGFIP